MNTLKSLTNAAVNKRLDALPQQQSAVSQAAPLAEGAKNIPYLIRSNTLSKAHVKLRWALGMVRSMNSLYIIYKMLHLTFSTLATNQMPSWNTFAEVRTYSEHQTAFTDCDESRAHPATITAA